MNNQKIAIHDANDLFAQVDMCESVKEAVQLIKKIDALKTALEAVDRFHENAVKFAELECCALLKVISLGGASKLRGRKRETAEWLAKLSPDEIERYTAMCSEGITIEKIYETVILPPVAEARRKEQIGWHEDYLIQKLKEDGEADFRAYIDEARQLFDDKTAEMYIERARHRLRDNGGLSIGEFSGIYVNSKPDVNAEFKLREAMLVRIRSLMRDLGKIRNISNMSSTRLYSEKIVKEASDKYRTNFDKNRWSSDPVLPFLMITLDRLGVLEDPEETYADILQHTSDESLKEFARKEIERIRAERLEAEALELRRRKLLARAKLNGGQ